MTTPKKKPASGKKTIGQKSNAQKSKPTTSPTTPPLTTRPKKGATPTAAAPRCPICGGIYGVGCIHHPHTHQRVSNLLIAPGARVPGVQMLPELRLAYVARRVAQNTGNHRLYALDLAQEMGVSVSAVYELIKHLRMYGAGAGTDFPLPLGIENTLTRGYVAAHVASQADDISFLGIINSKIVALHRQFGGVIAHIRQRWPDGQLEPNLRMLERCHRKNASLVTFSTTLSGLNDQLRATPDIVF